MSNAIYNHYSDNALWGGTVTANVAPSTSYALADLQSAVPGVRVRWGVKTVTITWTFSGAVTADFFALPVSNLQGSVLTLTNGAALSQAVTLPALPTNRIPLTAIVQFASSSSTTWNLVISGNAENIVLGGAAWLGQKRTFDRNFMWSFHEREQQFGSAVVNDYGTRYLQTLQTQQRFIDITVRSRQTAIAAFKAWHQDARFRPGLFWPDPSVNDAYVGVWDTDLDVERAYTNVNPISLAFAELSKGKPV